MTQPNSIVIAIVSATAVCIFFFCWPVYHKAYTDHMQRLEDDAWLQTQCSDPQFIVRMRQHADVCDRVRATFQQPAFLVGIQAVCPKLGWEALAAAVTLLLIAPSVILPYYRDRMDRLDRDRMLEACSPMMPGPIYPLRPRIAQLGETF
jgi:hypothetical protein